MNQIINYSSTWITGGLLIVMLTQIYRAFITIGFERVRLQGLVPCRLNKPQTKRLV